MSKRVIYDRTETLAASIASDAVTFGLMAFCIWFSAHMGGGWWLMVTTAMMFMWLSIKVPGAMDRTTVLNSKSEAIEWAQGLPDDA